MKFSSVHKKASLLKSINWLWNFVGMTGLEPATTGPPDQHSKPTELHPAEFSGCKSTKSVPKFQILICFFTFFGLLNLALLAITYKIRTFACGFISKYDGARGLIIYWINYIL